MANPLSIFAEPALREPRKPRVEIFWTVCGSYPGERRPRYKTRSEAMQRAKALTDQGFDVNFGRMELRNGDCWSWSPERI